MTQTDALDKIAYSGLSSFHSDFMMVLKVSKEFDRYYQLGKIESDAFLETLKKTLSSFNRKYKDLTLSLKKKADAAHLFIYFNEAEGLHAFFEKAAVRITGLSAIGLSSFDEVRVADKEQFQSALERMKSKAYLTYLDPNTGSSNFMVQKSGKRIELVCNWHDLENKNSPEARLCAYYALRRPFVKSVDVMSHAASMGFTHSIGLEDTPLDDHFEPFSRE